MYDNASLSVYNAVNDPTITDLFTEASRRVQVGQLLPPGLLDTNPRGEHRINGISMIVGYRYCDLAQQLVSRLKILSSFIARHKI